MVLGLKPLWIPETMACLMLMFMWSFGPLLREPVSKVQKLASGAWLEEVGKDLSLAWLQARTLLDAAGIPREPNMSQLRNIYRESYEGSLQTSRPYWRFSWRGCTKISQKKLPRAGFSKQGLLGRGSYQRPAQRQGRPGFLSSCTSRLPRGMGSVRGCC